MVAADERAWEPEELPLRSIIDHLLEGMAIVSPEWRYLYLNQRAVAQAQKSRESLLGRTMMECEPGFEKTALFRALAECMDQHTARVIENELTDPDGRRGWLEISVEPTSAGLLLRTIDITARKEAEQATERQIAELERSNAALEQYAFVASHDLRAPLRQIASFVQVLEEDFGNSISAAGREYMGYIVSAAARLQSLVNDLLAYSTIQRGPAPVREIDLGECVAAAVRDLAALPGIERTKITVGPLPRILGDQSAMRHVFQNLIENAVKFSSESATPEISITAHEDLEHWLVVVADNGVGIEPEFQPQLFQLFRRGHPSSRYPGRGIGLASCRRVLELYGAAIEADGEPGPGARLRVTIPKRSGT